jgi:hypothetical protein
VGTNGEIDAILLDGARRRQKDLRFAAVIATVLGLAGLGVAGAFGWQADFARIEVGSVLCLVVALIMLLMSLADPTRNEVARVMRERASDVVWCYVRVDRGRFLWLWTADGKPHATALPLASWWSAAEPSTAELRLIELLRQALPAATFGFTAEHEATFRVDPKRLRVVRGP